MDAETFIKIIRKLRNLGVDIRHEARRGMEHRLLYEHDGYYTLIISTRKMLLPLWLKRQLDPQDPGYQEGLDIPVMINRVYREWGLLGTRSNSREVIVSPDGVFMRGPWGPGIWFYAISKGRLVHPSGDGELKYGYQSISSPIYSVEYIEDNVKIKIISWPCHELGGVIVSFKAENADAGVVAIRPLNPMGIATVNQVKLTNNTITAISNNERIVIVTYPMADGAGAYSIEEDGDITEFIDLNDKDSSLSETGWASGGLIFLSHNNIVEFKAFIPFEREILPVGGWYSKDYKDIIDYWERIISKGYKFLIGDEKVYERYWRSIVALQILFDNGRITPGPTIYHNFWIRDSAYMAKAFLDAGYVTEARSIIENMVKCVLEDGYVGAVNCKPEPFEADSPGQLLWIIGEYLDHTKDTSMIAKLYPLLTKVASYIVKLFDEGASTGWLHPPSISAEDLGLKDHYYWDVYWSIAGLWSMVKIAEVLGERTDTEEYINLASMYEEMLFKDLAAKTAHADFFHPTSPNRLILDSGIGRSLVAIWPLRLLPEDSLLAKELVDNAWKYVYNGGFVHKIIWRAYGSYITMHLAEASLMLGYRDRLQELHKWLIRSSEPLGHWCEAHSVKTLKGIVGDYPHGWASADYIMLARNMIVHENYNSSILHVLRGAWEKVLREIDVEARTRKGRVYVKTKLSDNVLEVKLSTPKYNEVILYPPIGKNIVGIEPRESVIEYDEDKAIVESGTVELKIRYD